MARYTGPRDKVSRRFGVALFGSTKALEKRPFPPGQHGMRAGRKKKSDYGVMLAEKQKLRFKKKSPQKKKKRWRSGFSKKPAKTSAGCTRNLVKRFFSFSISHPTGQKPSHPMVIRYILTPILYSACVPKIHRSSRKAISTCCWNASAGLGKKHRSRKKKNSPRFHG